MKNSGYGRTMLTISLIGVLLMIAGSFCNSEAQIFSQDLIMHSTTTGAGIAGRGSGSSTATDYFSKNAMKTSQSDGTDSIIRFDVEKIITVDNKKKTYSEMTFKQLQELLDKAGVAFSEDANKEQLEAIKKMMGQMAASFSVTKAGPGENIAGYATERYLVKGPIEMEIHAAVALKIPAAYYDVMKLQVPANPVLDMKKLFDEMKKITGIPLKTVTTIKMMNMESKTTKIVTSIEKTKIPASVFEVPAGYKLVDAK